MSQPYINIPLAVLGNKNLNVYSAVLYGHIVSLTRLKGYSWASNKTLGDLLGVNGRSIQRYLKELQDEGFIEAAMDGQQRIIRVLELPMTEVASPTTQLSPPPHDKTCNHDTAVTPPHDTAVTQNINNSIINNKINTEKGGMTENAWTPEQGSFFEQPLPSQPPTYWERESRAFLTDQSFLEQFSMAKRLRLARTAELQRWFVDDLSLKKDYKSAGQIGRHFTSWYNKCLMEGTILQDGSFKNQALNQPHEQGERKKTVRELETERFFESLNNPK